MNRILILEINGDSATLLTADGEFRIVPVQPGWEVGMELDAACLELAIEEAAGKAEAARGRGHIVAMRRVRRWVVAVAACLLLLIGVQQGYRVLSTADASVEIAINPVVRIELNRLGRVVGLIGVNEDGKELLRKTESANSSAQETLRAILNQAIADGYLSEAGRDVLLLPGQPGRERSSWSRRWPIRPARCLKRRGFNRTYPSKSIPLIPPNRCARILIPS